MRQPHVLYSTTTRLAYVIASRFYGHFHYAWCAPQPAPDRFEFPNPPSSDPLTIYRNYERDIAGGDEHSAQITGNRRGLIVGASERLRQGMMTPEEYARIRGIVDQARLAEFKPLLLVIAYALVADLVKPAPPEQRARATSEEYNVENLPGELFDVLDLSM